ncbi:carboxylesterase/lipase family protein [Flavimarina sp. Hel_I_48]|uniref:carboxylesterase/lipase family protein n=1 Tax=Flavimarina sp. Hel_I_48 TaxID=1392488 RepID=UPI0004DF2999|nr:carboxylesterase family protein [Flavimarina sp. Hel_I_48]
MKLIFSILITLVFVSCKTTKEDLPKYARVSTQNGNLEGIYAPDTKLNMYYGIPYASPPVGDLRWKAPQPVENWTGTRDAKTFGDRPMQERLWDDLIYRSQKMSEDCLYLNIWAPANASGKKLPVLFYIHGGGFNAGDGSELRYDGSSMAQKGMVVVTINYRLNIFGFLASPELSAESAYNASGNYGLLDQVAALKWVKNNIAAFGGNPDQITVAGESAGSISVSSLMASPLSRDMIAGAIGESGAAINPTLAPVSLNKAETNGSTFVKAMGNVSLANLRAMDAEELFDIYKNAENKSFPTVIDQHFYTENLAQTFNAGKQAQVPLLVGWNSAELPGAAFMQGQETTPENFINRVEESYPENADEVLKLYAHDTPEEVGLSSTALISDGFIAFSTWKWFDLHRKNSDQPVYRYLYSKIRPQAEADSLAPKSLGAGHANEIEYALGNLHYIKAHQWTEEDYSVSETMQDYFANFIKTGNPNAESLPQWPAAEKDSAAPPLMNIDTKSQAEEAKDDDRYRFWDTYYSKN